VKSGGKTRTYTFPASGVLTVPIYAPKLNTKIPVVFTMPGTGYKRTNYLESTEYDNTGIYVTKVKKKSKKVVVDVYQARIGNYLKIKVGKKTYTKKFKKNSRYIKVTQKIKKQKKGAKICVTFYNKYNQVLDRANLKVK
jgi:hypothetical protein